MLVGRFATFHVSLSFQLQIRSFHERNHNGPWKVILFVVPVFYDCTFCSSRPFHCELIAFEIQVKLPVAVLQYIGFSL